MPGNHHTAKPANSSHRVLLIACVIIALFIGCQLIRTQISSTSNTSESAQVDTGATNYDRIIALSPSIVEIIYQLGLENRLVGVPRFANHPPEAKQKPCVGGYIDLNFEKVLELEPDCLILLREQNQLAGRFSELGIHTITVDHGHTAGIIDSIHIIGNAMALPRRAKQLAADIKNQLRDQSASYAKKTPKPRVLVCISRNTTSQQPDQVVIAGSAGYHRELIEMAGGVNAYQGPVSFPMLSREKLIELKPDVIIDMVNTDTWHRLGKERLLAAWQAFPEIKAIKNHRVIIIHGDQHLIPGPRFPLTLEQFAKAISPSLIQ